MHLRLEPSGSSIMSLETFTPINLWNKRCNYSFLSFPFPSSHGCYCRIRWADHMDWGALTPKIKCVCAIWNLYLLHSHILSSGLTDLFWSLITNDTTMFACLICTCIHFYMLQNISIPNKCCCFLFWTPYSLQYPEKKKKKTTTIPKIQFSQKY